MTFDLSKAYRCDRSQLHPIFAERLDQLLTNLSAQGLIFFVTEGYRSFERQQELYDQGRVNGKKKVTNAKPGQSMHQFRCGADLTYDLDANQSDGLQPSWDMQFYVLLQKEAHRVGLSSGLDWENFKDGPHLDLPGPTLKALQAAHIAGGDAGVTQYVTDFFAKP